MENHGHPAPTCAVCLQQVDNTRILPCGCHYCRDCLSRFVNAIIQRNRLNWPPRCCGVDITVQDVVWLEDDVILRAYQRVEGERRMHNPLYCSRPQCSALLDCRNSADEGGDVTCDKCGTSTCRKCKKPTHGASDTECREQDLDPALEQLAGENRWQRCPHCRRMISRMGGCAHMT